MSETPALTQQNPRMRLLIPLVVAFSYFLEQLDSTIITTAIPNIASGLGETPLRLNLALTSYILSLAVFIPVSGWVADKVGMRQTFCAAIAVFTLGSIACGAAVNLPMLVASRVLQGFGGAMLTPVGRLILLRSFPRSDLVTAMSYVSIPVVLGPTIGPLAGGLIATYTSWRWIFFVNVPFGLLGIVLAWRYVRDAEVQHPDRFDWPGFAICGLGMLLLEFGVESLGHPVLPRWATLVLFLLAASVLTLYMRYARRHSNAALDLAQLRVRTFRISVLTGGLTRITISAVPFIMPLMLQVGFGLSPIQSGSLTFVASIGVLAVRPITSFLLRRLGFDRLLVSNTVLCGLCIASLALIGPTTSHIAIMGYLLVYGMVRNLQFNGIQCLAFADIPAAGLSRATSLSSVAQQLSQGFGISVSAALLGMIAGSESALHVGDFHLALLILGGFTLVAVPGFLQLRPQDGAIVSGHRRGPAPAE